MSEFDPQKLQAIPVIAKCRSVILCPSGELHECAQERGHDGAHANAEGTHAWTTPGIKRGLFDVD